MFSAGELRHVVKLVPPVVSIAENGQEEKTYDVDSEDTLTRFAKVELQPMVEDYDSHRSKVLQDVKVTIRYLEAVQFDWQVVWKDLAFNVFSVQHDDLGIETVLGGRRYVSS